ncbi:MAG: zf-TFIIB domain-containing protein [Deinococcales bacterium]
MQKLCPIDGTPLMEMSKNGVIIDVCPECKGVWLDRGELEKLIQVAIEIEREYGDTLRRDPRDERDPRRDGDYDRHFEQRGYDPRYTQPQYRQPGYRRDDDDDDHRYGKKKKSTLGRIFDIFD